MNIPKQLVIFPKCHARPHQLCTAISFLHLYLLGRVGGGRRPVPIMRDARGSPDSAHRPESLAIVRDDVDIDRSTSAKEEAEVGTDESATRCDLSGLSPDDVSFRELGDFKLDRERLEFERRAPRPAAGAQQVPAPGSLPIRPRFTRPRVLELGLGLAQCGAPRIAIGLEGVRNDAPQVAPEDMERSEARSRVWARATDTPSPGTPLMLHFQRRAAHPAEEKLGTRRESVGREYPDETRPATPNDEAMRAARYCLCEDDLFPNVVFGADVKRDQDEQSPPSPFGLFQRSSFGRE